MAVARALVIRPPLILADEPTGQLDRANADRVLDLLLDATDSALMVCTHDPRVARRMARHWRMIDGD
jgi:ABC-type lipoprotein export system ATPase subunit